MPIESRPDSVWVVHLADDPQFTADLEQLVAVPLPRAAGVALEFSGMRYMNSSNLAKLLRLRKQLIELDGRLVLCCLGGQIWGLFQVTGLDKIFRFAPTVDEAVAMAKAEE